MANTGTKREASPHEIPHSGWQPIETAPDLERVIVAGWQKRSRSGVPGYWWVHEDATDDKGKPIDHPDARLWRPMVPPPDLPAPE